MSTLTGRQLQVLRLLGEGKTNRQIAETLGLSENTVRMHVERIRRALRAHTRGEAVAKARELGLLNSD